MSFLAVFLASFGLIFLAELGDKTQLMVLTLALRYGGGPVLGGAFAAFAILSGSAAALGRGLGELFSPALITSLSGVIFIVFGVLLFFRKDSEESDHAKPTSRRGFFAALGLIAVSEMGDKTQIGTLLLSVKYQAFFPVFLGSLLALSLAALIGVLLAGRLHALIPVRYIRPASAALFVVMGVATLIAA